MSFHVTIEKYRAHMEISVSSSVICCCPVVLGHNKHCHEMELDRLWDIFRDMNLFVTNLACSRKTT